MPSTRTQLDATQPTSGTRLSNRGDLAIVLPGLVVAVPVVALTSWGVSLLAYWAVYYAGHIAAGRLARDGRLPDWARGAERPEHAIDYSLPPPEHGPIFNGRADQAPIQTWLRRRRARRDP
jgi:hypothetical protein